MFYLTRSEALEIATANRAAHVAADIEYLFRGGPDFDAQRNYGYHHGWYHVGNFCFNVEDITGRGPCQVQAAFAYL